MKRLFFLFCLLPLALNGANIDFRNLNTNHFTTNGFRVSLKGFPTNSHATNHITTIASNYFLTVSGGGITNLTTEGVDGASYVQAVSTPGSSFDNVQWTLMNWFLPTHVASAMPMAEVGYDSVGGHGVFHLFGRNTNAYDNIAGMNFWALPSAADWPFSSADTRLAVLRIKNPVALPAMGTDLQGGYLLWEVRYNQTAKDRRTNDTYANVFVADQFGNVGLGHLGAGSDLNPGIHPPAKVTVYASPSNMYPAFAVMDETQTNNWMIVTNGRVGIGTNGPQASLHITPELTGMNFLRVDDTNGALRAQIGTLGNGTAYLWMGNIIPNSTNITFGQNTANGTTYINTPENTPSHVIAFSMGGFTKLLMGTNYFAPNSGVNMDLGISGQLFNALRTQTASIGTNSSIYTVEIFSSDPDGALVVNSPHLYPAFKVETNGNVSAVTFTTTGADPGFLLLRNSNLLGAVAFTHTGSQNASNVFDFRGVSNVVAGQVLKVHSVSGANVVLTNAADNNSGGVAETTYDGSFAPSPLQGIITTNYSYQSWPVLVASKTTNLLHLFFGGGEVHLNTNAVILMSTSTNAGANWSANTMVVSNLLNDPRRFAAGTDKRGRLYLFYEITSGNPSASWSNTVCDVSDDSGVTWTRTGSVPLQNAAAYNRLAPFGKIFEQDNYVYCAAYGVSNTVAGTIYLFRSSDRGTNWTVTEVFTTTTLGAAEPMIVGNGRGMIYCATRLNSTTNLTRFAFSTSTNWGETFTFNGFGISQIPTNSGNPTWMELDDDGNVMLATCDRIGQIVYLFMMPWHLTSDSANWNRVSPLTIATGVPGGYPTFLHGGNHRLLMAWYDEPTPSTAPANIVVTNITVPGALNSVQLYDDHPANRGIDFRDTSGGFFQVVQGTATAGSFTPVMVFQPVGDLQSFIGARRAVAATDGSAGTPNLDMILSETNGTTAIGGADIGLRIRNGNPGTVLTHLLGNGSWNVHATNNANYARITNGLNVGLNGVTITNILHGSATLNFASQNLGGFEDLPITVAGAADGDAVQIGVPSAATTAIAGSFTGFASNGVVYVRFVSTAATQDPASGTFRAIVTKVP